MPCIRVRPRADAQSGRAGFSLLELLVVCAFGSAITALLLGALLAQLKLARATAQRVAAADAVRTTHVVLGGEARSLAPSDVRSLTSDSLAIRAFRGSAIPCRSTGEVLLVRYRGARHPNPAKDSVLAVHTLGTQALALLHSRGVTDGCRREPDEELLEWRLSGDHTSGLLLLYESGSYYLSGRALRYRLGAEGRQPLTAEVFAHPGTAFGVGPAGLRYTLRIGDHTMAGMAWWPPSRVR